MQIILLEKVVNLGNLGDIVKVKDGYGRNFLIPQGKAKRATEANKAEFAERRAILEKPIYWLQLLNVAKNLLVTCYRLHKKLVLMAVYSVQLAMATSLKH